MFDNNWIKPPDIWDKAYTMYSLSSKLIFHNWAPAYEKEVYLQLPKSDEITKKKFKQIKQLFFKNFCKST